MAPRAGHLSADLDRLLVMERGILNRLTRRRALALIGGGVGAVLLAACGDDDDAVSSTTSSSSSTVSSSSSSSGSAAARADCEIVPSETGGPFPGDGSNGPNVLTESGVVRRDIRSSIGSASGTAQGVPLTVNLSVLRASGCTAYTGAAVYLWHCDREGRYSMYSQGAADENYLRGVQVADGNGLVTFTTIFPAAYSGRWPHIHFEIYPNQAEATSAGAPVRTTQLALPDDACNAVYATGGYESSRTNMARTSLSSDMVFRDGVDHQLATVSGSPSSGYTAQLDVAV